MIDEYSHYGRCKHVLLDHADHLVRRIKRGEINASVFEGLIETFLDQPVFDGQDKTELRRLAKGRLAA